MSNYTKKCKSCKGTGKLQKMDAYGIECPICEGTGVKLMSKVEEDLDDALEMLGDKMYKDDDRFIDLEEEDYEV